MNKTLEKHINKYAIDSLDICMIAYSIIFHLLIDVYSDSYIKMSSSFSWVPFLMTKKVEAE